MQDVFKKEMKKEREEVLRQWQQLRDEITRMEEIHEIQKVSQLVQLFYPTNAGITVILSVFTTVLKEKRAKQD